MAKFAELFAEPVYISDYGYALSAEAYPTREEAAEAFTEWSGDPCDPVNLTADAVRFGFPSAGIGEPGVPWWEAGASGRGSKAIWVLETG